MPNTYLPNMAGQNAKVIDDLKAENARLDETIAKMKSEAKGLQTAIEAVNESIDRLCGINRKAEAVAKVMDAHDSVMDALRNAHGKPTPKPDFAKQILDDLNTMNRVYNFSDAGKMTVCGCPHGFSACNKCPECTQPQDPQEAEDLGKPDKFETL